MPSSIFQTCPVEHILAFCYHFSLCKLPFMSFFNALLFDENIVEEGGGVISPSPLIPLSGLNPEHLGTGNGSTQPAFVGHFL